MGEVASKKYAGVFCHALKNGDIAYYVRYTKDGARHKKRVGARSQGWDERRAYEQKVKLEADVLPTQKKLDIAAVVDAYLKTQALSQKPRSMPNTRAKCAHILDFFKSFEAITPTSALDFQAHLAEKNLQKATINNVLVTLGGVVKFANAHFGANKKLEIKKHRLDNKRERFLSKDEVAALKDFVRPNATLFVFTLLSLNLGARLSATLAIKKDDINLEAQSCRVRDLKNGGIYTGYFDAETKKALESYLPTLKDARLFPQNIKTIQKGMTKAFEALFNKGGENAKQKVVIHTLRHTFASQLAIAGAPLQIIQKLLNHKDITMTMRYAHLMPDSGKEWVNRLW